MDCRLSGCCLGVVRRLLMGVIVGEMTAIGISCLAGLLFKVKTGSIFMPI